MIVQLMLWVSIALLVASALTPLLRLWRGPTTYDRAVALDVVAAAAVGLVVVAMAITRSIELLGLLVVLASVSFVSSTTIARFATSEREKPAAMMSPITPLASAIEPATPLIESTTQLLVPPGPTSEGPEPRSGFAQESAR